MKEAPFYIGQKVVCINADGHNNSFQIVKGEVYKISDLYYKVSPAALILEEDPNRRSKFHPCRFAPIEENHYEDVTKELAVFPQDEVPDVKTIKELV